MLDPTVRSWSAPTGIGIGLVRCCSPTGPRCRTGPRRFRSLTFPRSRSTPSPTMSMAKTFSSSVTPTMPLSWLRRSRLPAQRRPRRRRDGSRSLPRRDNALRRWSVKTDHHPLPLGTDEFDEVDGIRWPTSTTGERLICSSMRSCASHRRNLSDERWRYDAALDRQGLVQGEPTADSVATTSPGHRIGLDMAAISQNSTRIDRPARPAAPSRGAVEELREEHYNADHPLNQPSDLWVLRVKPDHGGTDYTQAGTTSVWGLGGTVDDAIDLISRNWFKLIRRCTPSVPGARYARLPGRRGRSRRARVLHRSRPSHRRQHS